MLVSLTAMLLVATTASAGTLVGESNTISLVTGDPGAEATIVKGTASYDSSGQATLGITTATAAASQIELGGALFDVQSEEECSFFGLIAGVGPAPGSLQITTEGGEASAQGFVLVSSGGEVEVPATKSVLGTTTSLSVSSALIANQTYNCVLLSAGIQRPGDVGGATYMTFPVSAPPPPTNPTPSGMGTGTTSAPPAPAPKGPPAALKIAKPKTTTVKAGKWATVKVRVSNTGGTSLTSGSLRVKPVKGVLVKPESQKLPVLAPGASWTLSVKVQLTEKANEKSTLGLSASGPGATTGTGSLVVKLKQ